MSDSTCLPSTKKIRLENTSHSNTNSSKQNNNVIIDDSKYNYAFEWTDKKEGLLCVGYVRQNIKQPVRDISTILQKYYQNGYARNCWINNFNYSNIKYMSNNKFICSFKTNDYQYASIVFKPFISTILSNTSSNDGNNSKTICEMKFKKTKKSCSAKNHEDAIQYGVICLPIKNKMDLDEFKFCFQNKTGSLSGLYPWNDSFRYYSTHCVKMYTYNKATSTTKACIIRNESILCPRKIRRSARKFYESVDIHKVTKNDIFSSIIMFINNKYYLCWKQNDKLVGEIKLDFTNFDYLFAISSECCDCVSTKAKDGIQLEMSLSYV